MLTLFEVKNACSKAKPGNMFKTGPFSFSRTPRTFWYDLVGPHFWAGGRLKPEINAVLKSVSTLSTRFVKSLHICPTIVAMTGYNERSKSSMRSDFISAFEWRTKLFTHLSPIPTDYFNDILTFWGDRNLALRHIIFSEEKVKFNIDISRLKPCLLRFLRKRNLVVVCIIRCCCQIDWFVGKKLRVAHLREKTWWSLGSYERCAMMQNWPSLNHINHKIHLPITYK